MEANILLNQITKKRKEELLKTLSADDLVTLRKIINASLRAFVPVKRQIEEYEKVLEKSLKKAFLPFYKLKVVLSYNCSSNHLFLTVFVGKSNVYKLEIDCQDKISLFDFCEGYRYNNSKAVYKDKNDSNTKVISRIYGQMYEEFEEISNFFKNLSDVEKLCLSNYSIKDNQFEVDYKLLMFIGNDIQIFRVTFFTECNEKIVFEYINDLYNTVLSGKKIERKLFPINLKSNYDGIDEILKENEENLLSEIVFNRNVLPAELRDI